MLVSSKPSGALATGRRAPRVRRHRSDPCRRGICARASPCANSWMHPSPLGGAWGARVGPARGGDHVKRAPARQMRPLPALPPSSTRALTATMAPCTRPARRAGAGAGAALLVLALCGLAATAHAQAPTVSVPSGEGHWGPFWFRARRGAARRALGTPGARHLPPGRAPGGTDHHSQARRAPTRPEGPSNAGPRCPDICLKLKHTNSRLGGPRRGAAARRTRTNSQHPAVRPKTPNSTPPLAATHSPPRPARACASRAARSCQLKRDAAPPPGPPGRPRCACPPSARRALRRTALRRPPSLCPPELAPSTSAPSPAPALSTGTRTRTRGARLGAARRGSRSFQSAPLPRAPRSGPAPAGPQPSLPPVPPRHPAWLRMHSTRSPSTTVCSAPPANHARRTPRAPSHAGSAPSRAAPPSPPRRRPLPHTHPPPRYSPAARPQCKDYSTTLESGSCDSVDVKTTLFVPVGNASLIQWGAASGTKPAVPAYDADSDTWTFTAGEGPGGRWGRGVGRGRSSGRCERGEGEPFPLPGERGARYWPAGVPPPGRRHQEGRT
jgi:hypothetical protein